MDILLLCELLLLLLAANGAPVAAKKIFGSRYTTPIDFGAHLGDGRPVLGKSKTWRGLVCSVLATGLCALVLGLGFSTGMVFAAAAMAGDLFSSFTKRRLGMVSSSMALGLDQVPESLFPLLVLYTHFSLTIPGVLLVLVLFFIVELLVSRLLYSVGLRDRPY